MQKKTQYIHSKNIDTVWIPVSDDNDEFCCVELSGNSNGLPVLFCHGGPGYHPTENYRDHQWFSPEKYRIVVMHQRGTGDSKPSVYHDIDFNPARYADLKVQDYVNDIEVVRKFFQIDKWHCCFGGSWGSTLAILYGQSFPHRVNALILRGVFTCTKDEMDIYFTKDGINQQFGKNGLVAFNYLIEYAEKNGYHIDPNSTSLNFIKTYFDLCVMENDPIAQHMWQAFETWADTPEDTNQLNPNDHPTKIDPYYKATAIFETIVFKDMLENDINILDVESVRKLKGISVFIVQGAKDTVCLPRFAKQLYEMLVIINKGIKTNLDLFIVESGKHCPYESAEMTHHLIECTDQCFALP